MIVVQSAARRAGARGRLADWAREVGRCMVAALACALAACGGGTTGDAGGGTLTPSLPELSGTVTDGLAVPDLLLQVTVKGNVGTARTAEGRRDALSGNYLASADQLSGPYLLKATSSDFDGALSVAVSPGTANITPLTTFVVAQLLAQDPFAYFDSLGGRGGFTAASAESIALAQQRVARYLVRELAHTVPDTLGDWVTTPFQAVAGDPMFDALAQLHARLEAAGSDTLTFTQQVAQEAARCGVESVSLTAGSVEDLFCPFTKSSQPDASDPAIQRLVFANRRGDTLTVRVRGEAVLSVRLANADTTAAGCTGAGCTGVSVVAPAADRTRGVSFDGTLLRGTAGRLSLAGRLQSAVPGVVLPGLPCQDNRYFLVQPSGAAQGWCATPDDFGLGAAGRSAASGASRFVYTFDGTVDGLPGPSVEVVLQGRTVWSVLVYSLDLDTGTLTPLYQCREGNCPGVVLGTAVVDASLGLPIELQPIRFEDALLRAVLPDGSLSATDTVGLQGSLTGYSLQDPSVLPLLPAPCAAAAPVVSVGVSDAALPVSVCAPEDDQGFVLAGSYLDGGNRVLYTQNLLTDGVGSFSPGNAINVTLFRGAVVRVRFDAFAGPSFVCEGAACTGVTVSAPDLAGQRTVSFSGTQLQEVGTAGVPADRTAVLSGSFVAPPP